MQALSGKNRIIHILSVRGQRVGIFFHSMESEFLWLWIQRTDSGDKTIPRPPAWLMTVHILLPVSPLCVCACCFNFNLNISLSAIPTVRKLVSGPWSEEEDGFDDREAENTRWRQDGPRVSPPLIHQVRDIVILHLSPSSTPLPHKVPVVTELEPWTVKMCSIVSTHTHSLIKTQLIDWIQAAKVQCAQNASPETRLSRYKCKWKLSSWPYLANINTRAQTVQWKKNSQMCFVCKDTKFYWLLISSLHEYNIDKVIRRVVQKSIEERLLAPSGHCVLSVFVPPGLLVTGHAVAGFHLSAHSWFPYVHCSLSSPVVSDASLLDLDRNPGAREQRESNWMEMVMMLSASSAMSPCLRS